MGMNAVTRYIVGVKLCDDFDEHRFTFTYEGLPNSQIDELRNALKYYSEPLHFVFVDVDDLTSVVSAFVATLNDGQVTYSPPLVCIHGRMVTHPDDIDYLRAICCALLDIGTYYHWHTRFMHLTLAAVERMLIE